MRGEPWEPGICPRCLGPLPVGYPGALSRVCDEEVCSPCGTDEGLIDWMRLPRRERVEWPVARQFGVPSFLTVVR
jgi:hypothetical protein